MDLAFRIISTLLFSCFVTIILFFIENRSNISSLLIIPIIVSLLTKYVLGDWDKGFQWSLLDLAYWFSILSTSYSTLYFLSLSSSTKI
jgi:hypothetical protein